MTAAELLGVVLGGGTVSAVIGSVSTMVAAKRAARVEEKKDAASTEIAHVEASTKAASLMGELIEEMREERKRLIAEADAKRAEGDAVRSRHVDCLQLVGELRGHVDQLEPRLQQVETKLDECHRDRAKDRVELADFKAKIHVELAKRPPSNPGFPKAPR